MWILQHLVEKSWFALTETCLAFTVFRDDFSSHFVALFTILLFLKCFHWLAEDRVDFMERTPVISRLFHIRVIGEWIAFYVVVPHNTRFNEQIVFFAWNLGLLITLAFLDSFFAAYAYHSLVTKGVSVQLVFGFEVWWKHCRNISHCHKPFFLIVVCNPLHCRALHHHKICLALHWSSKWPDSLG